MKKFVAFPEDVKPASPEPEYPPPIEVTSEPAPDPVPEADPRPDMPVTPTPSEPAVESPPPVEARPEPTPTPTLTPEPDAAPMPPPAERSPGDLAPPPLPAADLAAVRAANPPRAGGASRCFICDTEMVGSYCPTCRMMWNE